MIHSFTHASGSNFSNKKWQNGLSASRIINELPDVIAMFPQCPDGHLIEAGERKESRDGRVGHGGEADPRQHLVRIVGAGDEPEEPCKRIQRRQGNLSDLASRRTKISKGFVDAEVADLRNDEPDHRQF